MVSELEHLFFKLKRRSSSRSRKKVAVLFDEIHDGVPADK
jgi:hypothetical protein